jgi:zinc transport system permease protein
MLVVPAATARNLARNLSSLFWIAVFSAWAAGFSGVILSFYWDSPAGATTILISCILFLLSWLKNRLI